MKELLRNLITSGIKGEAFREDVRKAMIINSFSFVGMISLITFAINGILTSKLFYTTTALFFLVVCVSNFLIFRKTKNCFIHGNVLVTFMFLLEILLIVKIGDGTTGIFWFYLFPLLSFFILGKKVGSIYALCLIFITIFLMYVSPFQGMTYYPEEIRFRFIFTYFATGLLAFIFENVRESTYFALKIADEKKSFYLTQTLQQKEEIQAQTEKLIETNVELEKLSLVAAKTDNAVIILDKSGNFEWINEGYKRIYGHGIDKLKESGKNFIQSSNYQKIEELFSYCKKEKKAVNYETSAISKNGYKIFVKTNLTPILDDNHEISKFVVLDTDITDLKEAEIEILQKTKEIMAQKEEILAQKDALEEHNEKIENQNIELENKNEFIETQNEQIKSSIRAALTIQDAILPNLSILEEVFENFIIFKPKDIVSGDFYWAKKIDNFLMIAVVDCTGHGVPGAFMSMIASQMLNDIIMQQKVTNPADILEELDKKVVKTLRQDETDNKNGMDALIIKVENNLQLTFSGAKRPLFLLKDSTNKSEILKGCRRSIGGFSQRNKEEFASITKQLCNSDLLYLTTDGFTDQNNFERKRFGTEKLVQIINNNARSGLDVQKNILEHHLIDWMQNTTQRDDIILIGLKVK